MQWSTFLERISERVGDDSLALDSMVAVALNELGRYIPEIDRDHLDLPSSALEHLAVHDVEPGDAELQAVAERLNLPIGQARELVLVVATVIDEAQVDESKMHWRRNLSDDIVETLARSRPRAAHRGPAGRTVADGQPGSDEPVSTATPGSHNPLATAKPGTNDKTLANYEPDDAPTLAEGRPGSLNPIGETDSD